MYSALPQQTWPFTFKIGPLRGLPHPPVVVDGDLGVDSRPERQHGEHGLLAGVLAERAELRDGLVLRHGVLLAHLAKGAAHVTGNTARPIVSDRLDVEDGDEGGRRRRGDARGSGRGGCGAAEADEAPASGGGREELRAPRRARRLRVPLRPLVVLLAHCEQNLHTITQGVLYVP